MAEMTYCRIIPELYQNNPGIIPELDEQGIKILFL
jgi:hypothetical protein